MIENHYDKQSFFEQYKEMDRSVNGLSAAGEWHELQKMLPDFTGKRVLDLGCGFGWHCRYAQEQGARQVVGVDLSSNMLQKARQMTSSSLISYLQMPIEAIDFGPDSFDIVISSLALHYIPDFRMVCHKIRHVLPSGGVFVFSVEHPVFTAQGPQQWHRNPDGAKTHWPVDSYFSEGERHAVFLGECIAKYHKTLTTYLNTLLSTGFSITSFVEPQPPQHLLDLPYMQDELRRPMMMLIAASKQ